MGDPPAQLSPLSGAYLLIVVGEPFSEEHKQLILQKIQQGKQNYCLMPACNNFFVNFYLQELLYHKIANVKDESPEPVKVLLVGHLSLYCNEWKSCEDKGDYYQVFACSFQSTTFSRLKRRICVEFDEETVRLRGFSTQWIQSLESKTCNIFIFIIQVPFLNLFMF